MTACVNYYEPLNFMESPTEDEAQTLRKWLAGGTRVPTNWSNNRAFGKVTKHLLICQNETTCPTRHAFQRDYIDELDQPFKVPPNTVVMREFKYPRESVKDNLSSLRVYRQAFRVMTWNGSRCQARKSTNNHKGQRYWEMPLTETKSIREKFKKCCYYGKTEDGSVNLRFIRGPLSIVVIACNLKTTTENGNPNEQDSIRFGAGEWKSEEPVFLFDTPQEQPSSDALTHTPMELESSDVLSEILLSDESPSNFQYESSLEASLEYFRSSSFDSGSGLFGDDFYESQLNVNDLGRKDGANPSIHQGESLNFLQDWF